MRRRPGAHLDPIGILWRALSSVRVSLIPIALLVPALLAAALLPQAPVDVRGYGPAYAEWLEAQRETFGTWLPVLDNLSLFRISDAFWFRCLLAWLALSLGVLVLSRLEPTLSNRRRERLPLADVSAPLAGEHVRLHTDRSLAAATDTVKLTLRDLGYKQRHEARGSGSGYSLGGGYAERNRWQRLGTLANHLGLCMLIAAGVLGSVIGYREPTVPVTEGSVIPVGHGTNLSIRVNSFTATRHPAINITTDYVSNLTLLKNGTTVRDGHLLRVNHPLRYDGISFHQVSYGPAVDLKVTGAAGEPLYDGGVPLLELDPANRPAGTLSLPGYQLRVTAPRPNGVDGLVPAGEVGLELYHHLEGTRAGAEAPLASFNARQGRPVTAGGLTVTFQRERLYSGIGVTYNPATPYVWGGAVLMLAGLISAFGFPHRAVRIRLQPNETGTSVVLAPGRSRPMGRKAEFERAVGAIQRALDARADDGRSGSTMPQGEPVYAGGDHGHPPPPTQGVPGTRHER